jgi:hypothetical protein
MFALLFGQTTWLPLTLCSGAKLKAKPFTDPGKHKRESWTFERTKLPCFAEKNKLEPMMMARTVRLTDRNA